ncbi:peptidase inhibitor family I36 protein [Streptomyces sp. NPDC006923]|uniref:peptidase inhibitor family I36 protein n=1 Tax=Streptomyces sp. NPDC006923 TaxID=3155355 RepID=UPI0033CD0C9A
MGFLRKLVTAAVSLPLSATAVIAMAPQAGAASGPACGGNCLVFTYNSNISGSRTYFWGSDVPDLAPYTFLTSGAGQGQALKNNAAAALNDSPDPSTIFYNSNYGGSCDTLGWYTIADQLHNTYNNNASFRLGYSNSKCYQFN